METHPSQRTLRDLPPRHVPIFTKATVLFGGFMQQFGWVFFAMGSLFAWIFVPASEARFWFEAGKDWQEVPGMVVSGEATNSTVNDVTVYRYLHAFEVNGQRFTGKSFAVGQRFAEGEEVTVRYDANRPADGSHIVGSQRAVFPALVLFVLIFPLLGTVFIIIGLRQNWQAIRLLEIGEFTRGTMQSKVATNVEVNDRPVFKYQFEFEAGGRCHAATCKTHQTRLVEDEQREIILYDKYNPGFNVVFDAAGNMPAITPEGTLAGPSLGQALGLLLPMVGLGVNLYFLLAGAPGLLG